jgi:hypothetical protein
LDQSCHIANSAFARDNATLVTSISFPRAGRPEKKISISTACPRSRCCPASMLAEQDTVADSAHRSCYAAQHDFEPKSWYDCITCCLKWTDGALASTSTSFGEDSWMQLQRVNPVSWLTSSITAHACDICLYAAVAGGRCQSSRGAAAGKLSGCCLAHICSSQRQGDLLKSITG